MEICPIPPTKQHIEVVLRLKPLQKAILTPTNDARSAASTTSIVVASGPRYIKVMNPSIITSVLGDSTVNNKIFEYGFDWILPENSSQEDTWNHTCPSLLKEFFAGNNALLFCYGPSGSGKTFTMQGNHKYPGMLPRILQFIFNSIQNAKRSKSSMITKEITSSHNNNEDRASNLRMKGETANNNKKQAPDTKEDSFMAKESKKKSKFLSSKPTSSYKKQPVDFNDHYISTLYPNIEFNICISYMECYNEKLYDLLRKPSAHPEPLDLRINHSKETYVPGLTEPIISSFSEARKFLSLGIHNRRVQSTHLNQDSSRSHSVFTIKMTQTPRHCTPDELRKDPSLIRFSKFSIIDLAGSERISRSLVEGSRMKEATNINHSLFTLGRCIGIMRHNQALARRVRQERYVANLTSLVKENTHLSHLPTSIDNSIVDEHPANTVTNSLLAMTKQPESSDMNYSENTPNILPRSDQTPHLSKRLQMISSALPQPMIIPFRDSLLTKLFREFFMGSGKAVMIVTVHPSASEFDETVQALHFGTITKSIVTTSCKKKQQAPLNSHTPTCSNARALENEKSSMSSPLRPIPFHLNPTLTAHCERSHTKDGTSTNKTYRVINHPSLTSRAESPWKRSAHLNPNDQLALTPMRDILNNNSSQILADHQIVSKSKMDIDSVEEDKLISASSTKRLKQILEVSKFSSKSANYTSHPLIISTVANIELTGDSTSLGNGLLNQSSLDPDCPLKVNSTQLPYPSLINHSFIKCDTPPSLDPSDSTTLVLTSPTPSSTLSTISPTLYKIASVSEHALISSNELPLNLVTLSIACPETSIEPNISNLTPSLDSQMCFEKEQEMLDVEMEVRQALVQEWSDSLNKWSMKCNEDMQEQIQLVTTQCNKKLEILRRRKVKQVPIIRMPTKPKPSQARIRHDHALLRCLRKRKYFSQLVPHDSSNLISDTTSTTCLIKSKNEHITLPSPQFSSNQDQNTTQTCFPSPMSLEPKNSNCNALKNARQNEDQLFELQVRYRHELDAIRTEMERIKSKFSAREAYLHTQFLDLESDAHTILSVLVSHNLPIPPLLTIPQADLIEGNLKSSAKPCSLTHFSPLQSRTQSKLSSGHISPIPNPTGVYRSFFSKCFSPSSKNRQQHEDCQVSRAPKLFSHHRLQFQSKSQPNLSLNETKTSDPASTSTLSFSSRPVNTSSRKIKLTRQRHTWWPLIKGSACKKMKYTAQNHEAANHLSSPSCHSSVRPKIDRSYIMSECPSAEKIMSISQNINQESTTLSLDVLLNASSPLDPAELDLSTCLPQQDRSCDINIDSFSEPSLCNSLKMVTSSTLSSPSRSLSELDHSRAPISMSPIRSGSLQFTNSDTQTSLQVTLASNSNEESHLPNQNHDLKGDDGSSRLGDFPSQETLPLVIRQSLDHSLNNSSNSPVPAKKKASSRRVKKSVLNKKQNQSSVFDFIEMPNESLSEVKLSRLASPILPSCTSTKPQLSCEQRRMEAETLFLSTVMEEIKASQMDKSLAQLINPTKCVSNTSHSPISSPHRSLIPARTPICKRLRSRKPLLSQGVTRISKPSNHLAIPSSSSISPRSDDLKFSTKPLQQDPNSSYHMEIQHHSANIMESDPSFHTDGHPSSCHLTEDEPKLDRAVHKTLVDSPKIVRRKRLASHQLQNLYLPKRSQDINSFANDVLDPVQLSPSNTPKQKKKLIKPKYLRF